MRNQSQLLILFNFCCIVGLINCGGRSSTQAAPNILEFSPGNSQITIGEKTTLIFTFSNGNGVIDQGIGAVSSGIPATVAPTAPTTYHLTVTNSSGTSAQRAASVAVVFNATGQMHTGRVASTATLLSNGQVLIAGGYDQTGTPVSSAELYDPLSGTFVFTGSMTQARAEHAAVALPNGRVLIAGGNGSTLPIPDASIPLENAELYDPSAGTFSPAADMKIGRIGPLATLIPENGLVLIAGGNNFNATLTSAELYDPGNNIFVQTGNMNTARDQATSTATSLVPGDQILFTGGSDASLNPIASAELYNSASGKFILTGSMNEARSSHAAVQLPNGLVLVAGGRGGTNISPTFLTSAELFDPSKGTFTVTGPLLLPRAIFSMVLIPSGQVILAGGSNQDNGYLAEGEGYDPVTGTFVLTASLGIEKIGGNAVILSGGQALFMGGRGVDNQPTTDAEIYP